MSNYLVTGRAGSGKSAAVTELQKRGFTAYDTDAVDGLSSWVEQSTGTKVQLRDTTNVDLDKYSWLWDAAVLRHFLLDKDGVFVCGSADNDFDFDALFAKHFVLTVSARTQTQRLLHRTASDYGQDPAMHAIILARQAAHIQKAQLVGAELIDAEQPIAGVVDELLRLTQ